MILVDTSAWIEYFRHATNASEIQEALSANQVLMHPWILGELLLGGIGKKSHLVDDLRLLPCADVIADDELLLFIERNRLWTRGIGYVDAQLIAAARVHAAAVITHDKSFASVAASLGVVVG